MRTRFTLLFAFTIILCIYTSAQSTVNYAFSNSTTASLTDMSTGSTNILVPTSTTTDYASAAVLIGFDYWLMGTRYTYFSVNSNGLMRLGKTVVSNTGNNSLSTGSNLPLLTAFWDNLNSYTVSSTSRVRYKVTGTAPNRVLTVEWKDFIVSNNSSSGSQLSRWQIRLYETTGVFEYVYGRMQIATGSSTVTASIGMTSANSDNRLIYVTSISSPAVLRTTGGVVNNLVNSNVVGNIANLNSVADGSRTQYTFTSWVPTAAPSGLNFTSVGSSSMQLNWTDNSSNERGFVIYRSDDGGVTYNFVSQTAANATSSVQSGLAHSTTYYWKVYAVTEGALSASVNGSQTTTSCVGAPLTNTMALNGATTVNWSSAAAWSLGHSPTACENAVITHTRSSSGTMIVNMDVSATVNNLTINGVYSSSGNKILQVLTNANALTVLGDLNISCSGGTGTGTEVQLLASTGSVVTVKGSSTIGQVSDTRKSTIGGVTGQDPDYYFKGNLTFNVRGSTNSPGTYYFDGGASQTLNNLTPNYDIIFADVEVGKLTTTTLTVTGAEAATTYTNGGNLNVNSNSTLILTYDAAFNQFTPGTGAMNLKANATLKLGDFFYGQTGSNFPTNYSAYSIDPASTVEYNYTGGSNQIIYTGVEYGNLAMTGSTKTITSDLYIDGNFTVNSTASFYMYDATGSGTGYMTILYGNTMVNNGAIIGLATNSRFGFYGDAAQTYSGTGTFGTLAVPFQAGGIDIANTNNVTLNAPIVTSRLNLFYGTFINSNQFTVGNGTYGVVQRGGSAGFNAGSLDNYPTQNTGTDYTIYYADANAVITGYEIPVTRAATYVYSDNVSGVTLAGGDFSISTDLQLLQNTFNIDVNKLLITGTITRTSGNINGSGGTLEMNGTSAQSIPASTFLNDNLKNLIISNTNNASGVTLGGAVDIYRSVTFGASGLKLTTGGFLTFKSTSTETAWLGNMTGKTISGAATVERYIPNHAKAWQLLSTPTFGQTVNASWQEGNVPLGNTVPNHGTIITSTFAGAGFDIVSGNNPSMKTYDATTNTWVGIANTSISIANQKGYMLFVRGDRSVQNTSTPATYTILRTKGTLYTPANPPSVTNLASNTFQSVGNPYASAIDLTLLSRTGGVQDVYYVWDPKLTIGSYSAYGLGGYQTFVRNGSTYDVIPGGGSYPTEICKTIESGQAFFVRAPLAIGSVSFTEACKATGSNLVTRAPMAPITTRFKQLRTNLRVIAAGESILIDGNRVQYNESWSNNIDIEDAVKIGNTGENLGIARNGNTLAVERRSSLQKTDTIFYKLGQLRVQQYEFEFIPTDMVQPGMTAYLEDKYLHTSTAVSLQDTSRVRFNIVNIPGSYAADRFMLVFRKKAVGIPVINVNADTRKNSGVEVAEKTSPEEIIPGINVYPNPVVNKMMQVQFSKQPIGNYSIQLTNAMGQMVYNGSIQLGNSNMVKPIRLNESIAAGTYQLTVISETGIKTTQQINIQ